jgi:hypothetical protein
MWRLTLIYRPIPNYEGLYEISATGAIRNCKTRRFIDSYFGKKGYWLISLSKNGVCKTYALHKLVARVFVPNPNNLPVVMHIDNNRRNIWASNLEWGTSKQNSLDYHKRQKYFNFKTLTSK